MMWKSVESGGGAEIPLRVFLFTSRQPRQEEEEWISNLFSPGVRVEDPFSAVCRCEPKACYHMADFFLPLMAVFLTSPLSSAFSVLFASSFFFLLSAPLPYWQRFGACFIGARLLP